MFNIGGISHSELNSKIHDLSNRIDRTESLFSSFSQSEWDGIFELCKEINDNFKGVRYPSKDERDIAWQNFFNLRNKAYQSKKEKAQNHSYRYFDDIMNRLRNVDYDIVGDFIVGKILSLGLLKETKEDMKAKGRELGSIGSYFKSVKHEMLGEHKSQIHERIIEIRQHHDDFWEKYKSYQEEKNQLYHERHKAWQEKQERGRQIKAQIETNIEKNKEKLYKAKDALDHFESKKSDLQSKIYDSYNDNWKYKAESWLYEFNDKISSIEDQIRRLERWIDEDRDKLRNWR